MFECLKTLEHNDCESVVLLLQLVFCPLCFPKSCWDRYMSNEKAFFTMAYNKYTIDLESITFEVETSGPFLLTFFLYLVISSLYS